MSGIGQRITKADWLKWVSGTAAREGPLSWKQETVVFEEAISQNRPQAVVRGWKNGQQWC